MSRLTFSARLPAITALCCCLAAFPLATPAQPALEKTDSASPADTAAQDQYVNGYVLWQEAEKLNQEGNGAVAFQKYQQAAQVMDRVAKENPAWQPTLVKYRREEIAKKIALLQKKAGFAGSGPASAPAAGDPNVIAGTPPLLANPSAGTSADLLMPPPAEQGNPNLPQESDRAAASAAAGAQEGFMGQMKSLQEATQSAQDSFRMMEESARMMAETLRRSDEQRKAAEIKATDATNRMLMMRGSLAEKEDALAVKNKEMEQMLQGAGSNQEASTAALGELTKQRDELHAQLKTMRDEFQSNLDETSAAMKELEQLRKESTRMTTENDVLKKQIEGYQTVLGGDTVPEFLEKSKKLRADLAATQQKVEDLIKENQGKEAEVTSLRQGVETMQKTIAALRKENTAYETKLTDLALQIKTLNGAIAAAKGSARPELMAENQLLRDALQRQLGKEEALKVARQLAMEEVEKKALDVDALKKHLDSLVQQGVLSLKPEERAALEKAEAVAITQEQPGIGGVQDTMELPTDTTTREQAKAEYTPPPAAPAENRPPEESTEARALMRTAEDALRDNKFDAAEKSYENYLKLNPKNVGAMVNLGMAKTRQKKYTAADATLRKAIALEDNNAFAYFMLGVNDYQREKLDEALKSIGRSLQIEPQNAKAHHYLGVVHSKQKQPESAKSEFQKAIEIDPEYGAAHFNLAVLHATGKEPDLEKAEKHYLEAVRLGSARDPEMEKIMNMKKEGIVPVNDGEAAPAEAPAPEKTPAKKTRATTKKSTASR